MNKRILVTGGAGFIGSSFVRFLSTKKIKIHVIDNLTYASIHLSDLLRLGYWPTVSNRVYFAECPYNLEYTDCNIDSFKTAS